MSGGVFDRLTDPQGYTGVYAERFRTGDGRINADYDLSAGGHGARQFVGNTNTGSDEHFSSIAQFTRPNLRHGGTRMAFTAHAEARADQARATGGGGAGTAGHGARFYSHREIYTPNNNMACSDQCLSPSCHNAHDFYAFPIPHAGNAPWPGRAHAARQCA